jgi:hypothetical protein
VKIELITESIPKENSITRASFNRHICDGDYKWLAVEPEKSPSGAEKQGYSYASKMLEK